jgi:hypothetical protein
VGDTASATESSAKPEDPFTKLPVDVQHAISLATRTSITANADYEAALNVLRQKPEENAAGIRACLVSLPGSAHWPRFILVHLLGWVGGDEDAPILEEIASAPLVIGTAENQVEGDARRGVVFGAVLALGRLAHRGSGGAIDALKRLIETADAHVVPSVAIELTRVERLASEDVSAASARGIPVAYRRATADEIPRIDPSSVTFTKLDGRSAKQPVNPPPAIP